MAAGLSLKDELSVDSESQSSEIKSPSFIAHTPQQSSYVTEYSMPLPGTIPVQQRPLHLLNKDSHQRFGEKDVVPGLGKSKGTPKGVEEQADASVPPPTPKPAEKIPKLLPYPPSHPHPILYPPLDPGGGGEISKAAPNSLTSQSSVNAKQPNDDPFQEPEVAMGLSKKSQDFNTNLASAGLYGTFDDDLRLPSVAIGQNKVSLDGNTNAHKEPVVAISVSKADQELIEKSQIQVSIGTEDLGTSKEVLTPDIGELVIPFIKPFPPASPEDDGSKIKFEFVVASVSQASQESFEKSQIQGSIGHGTLGTNKELSTPENDELMIPFVKQFPPAFPEDDGNEIDTFVAYTMPTSSCDTGGRAEFVSGLILVPQPELCGGNLVSYKETVTAQLQDGTK